MKKFVVIMIIAVLLVGCGPSEKSVQVAIGLTQTAQPTLTPIPPTPTSTATPSPTPDIRVIDIDPQKLLLQKGDLPVDCKYILPGPGWIEPLGNAKIVSDWTVERGKEYLLQTERIDGWVVSYYCSDKTPSMPQEVGDNVVIYASVEGAGVMFAKFLDRTADGYTEVSDITRVGDLSRVWMMNDASGEGKKVYRYDFVYKNILHGLYIWGPESDVKLEFVVAIAQKLLSKLQELPLSDMVYFKP
jgi:hypothetical protein